MVKTSYLFVFRFQVLFVRRYCGKKAAQFPRIFPYVTFPLLLSHPCVMAFKRCASLVQHKFTWISRKINNRDSINYLSVEHASEFAELFVRVKRLFGEVRKTFSDHLVRRRWLWGEIRTDCQYYHTNARISFISYTSILFDYIRYNKIGIGNKE